jgi:hypothetical protein
MAKRAHGRSGSATSTVENPLILTHAIARAEPERKKRARRPTYGMYQHKDQMAFVRVVHR